MKTRLTLRPGQKGTRRLCEQYGERLVCVRYRYDDARKVRLKTVELIVGEVPWWYCRPWRPIPFDQRVLVAIQYGERELGRKLKAAGGIWRPAHRAWEVPYHVAERLGVHGLVLVERAPHRNNKGPWRPKPPDASTHRCAGGVGSH
ncbi:MAG TPA: hypothetical protein VI078_11505 [bacterium]